MKTAEIKEFTTKELQERIDVEQSSLIRMRMNHAVSPLDNPLKIKSTRRNVARMATELQTRRINENAKTTK